MTTGNAAWNKLRGHVIQRDGGRCMKCAETKLLHIHHSIPRDIGGEDVAENLVTLCEGCHMEWTHFYTHYKVELWLGLLEWLEVPRTAYELTLMHQAEWERVQEDGESPAEFQQRYDKMAIEKRWGSLENRQKILSDLVQAVSKYQDALSMEQFGKSLQKRA